MQAEPIEEEMAWSNLAGRAAEQPRRVLTCFWAGQLAGLVFLGVWVIAYLGFLSSEPFDWPIRVVASFILGEAAITSPTALTYVLGILVNQLLPALFWSMAYAWVVMSPRFVVRMSTCVGLGLFIGLAAMWIDVFFLIPPLMGILHDHDLWWVYLPRAWDWIAHIAYGISLGWFFAVLQPRIEGEGQEEPLPAR